MATNNGIFIIKNYTINLVSWTPIVVPEACNYMSLVNTADDMRLVTTDVGTPDELPLARGAQQIVIATYFRGDYRFNPGDILFFAKGVNLANSTVTFQGVKR